MWKSALIQVVDQPMLETDGAHGPGYLWARDSRATKKALRREPCAAVWSLLISQDTVLRPVGIGTYPLVYAPIAGSARVRRAGGCRASSGRSLRLS